jgi:HEAT repeat protein
MKRLRISFGLLAAGLALACLPAEARAQEFLDKKMEDWAKDLGPDKSPLQRRSAAFALGKIGKAAEGTLGQLKDRLTDDVADVREAAAYAIGEICADAGKPYMDAQKTLCD